MPSVSTLVNGVRQKLAGRALMDVAFSNSSTNGVQNKVIKAKFDEIDGKISTVEQVELFNGSVTAGSDITLNDNINKYKHIIVVDGNLQSESATLLNGFYGTNGRGLTINCGITAYNSTISPAVMSVSDIALTNTDGIHYHVERSAQVNISATGVEFFSGTRTSNIIIYGSN